MYTNLVIGGAGAKNYASLGAISKLTDILINVKRILGVSSGSILATLIAVGCTPEELKDYYDMVDLSQFKINYSNIYTYYKLIRYKGIHNSEVFREEIIHKLLYKKTGNGNITFKEIFEKYNKILVIPAACVNKREMFYYNYESNPDMSVKFAIEQSCCVPGIFYPVTYKGNTIVDAGIIDNYPLYYFNKEDVLPNSRLERILPMDEILNKNTIGILIIDDNVSKTKDDPYLGDDDTSSFSGYMKCVLNTILTTNSRCRIGSGYWENTLAINIGIAIDGVSDMVLSPTVKKKLYENGESEAEKFINLYNFSRINL